MYAEADEVVGSEVGVVVTHDGLDCVDDALCHVRDLVASVSQDLEVDPDATTGVPQSCDSEFNHLSLHVSAKGQLELEHGTRIKWRAEDSKVDTLIEVLVAPAGEFMGNSRANEGLAECAFEFDASLKTSLLTFTAHRCSFVHEVALELG